MDAEEILHMEQVTFKIFFVAYLGNGQTLRFDKSHRNFKTNG